MEYKIIASEHLHPVTWAGGITTQLYIFPETADYQQKNFQFRLSTATVDAEKSDFTPLSGISRKLMVLAGSVTLIHENHYSRQLKKFDVDVFEGDWKTSSIGKCTDFNLMTRGNTTGELSSIIIKKDQYIKRNLKQTCDICFIYAYSGRVRINIKNEMIMINKGNLLILNKLTARNFEIKGIEDTELVFSEITL